MEDGFDTELEDPKSLTKVHEGKQTSTMNTSLAVTGALAHRLQHRTAQHGQRGLERDLAIDYLALQTTFAK